MIKRTYFMAVEKGHQDGNGSYSHNSATASHRSWLPNPVKFYDDMAGSLAETLKDEPGDKVQVISFNRI